MGTGVTDQTPKPINLDGIWFTFDAPGEIFNGAEVVLLGRNTVEEDYAILKLNLDGKKLPCVPVSTAAISTDADIWALGYPDLDTPKALGDTVDRVRGKYVTLGRVTSTDRGRCLTCPSYYFVTDADSVFGMSGGIIADRSGSAIGVISRAVPSEDGKKNDTASVPVSWIVKQAFEKLGDQGAKAAFNCQ
jgi:hypothetical protein